MYSLMTPSHHHALWEILVSRNLLQDIIRDIPPFPHQYQLAFSQQRLEPSYADRDVKFAAPKPIISVHAPRCSASRGVVFIFVARDVVTILFLFYVYEYRESDRSRS